MAIVRGVKFVDIWRGEGVPQGASFNGITVVTEVRNGTTYYCVTILETDDLFLDGWDSGYSVSSDMRVTPKISGGSGGDITLANVALWYNSFISAGFDLRGSRMERLYNGTVISGGIVESAVVGVGIITVSAKIDGSAIDIPATGIENYSPIPYLFGDFENLGASLPNENKEVELFGGEILLSAYNDFSVYAEDPMNCPLEIDFKLCFASGINPTSIYIPENSYLLIVGGLNSGYKLKLAEGTYARTTVNTLECYEIRGEVVDGLLRNDDDITLSVNYATDANIPEASTFKIVQLRRSYTIPTGTVSDVKTSDGKAVKAYVSDNNTLSVNMENRVVEVVQADFANNLPSTEYVPLDILRAKTGSFDQSYDWRYESNHGIYTTSATTTDGSSLYQNTLSGSRNYVCDRDGSTFYRFNNESSSPIALSRRSMAFNFVTISPVQSIKGLLIDLSFHNFTENTPTDGARIGVYVFCSTTQASGSTQHTTAYHTIYNNSNILLKYTGTTQTQQGDLVNFPSSYYLDSVPTGFRSYNDTDDKFSDDYKFYPVGTPMQKRGLIRLEFTDTTALNFIKLGVGKLYVVIEVDFIYQAGQTASSVDSWAAVKELAFYGDVSDTQDTDISLSAASPHVNKTVSGAFADLSGRMDWSRFSNHTNNIGVDTTPVRYYTSDKSTTADLIQSLMRESWSAVDISPTGNFRTVSLDGMIGSDVAAAGTHVFEVPSFALASDAIDYDLENIPNNGIIQYNATGNGSYSSSITISNADKTTYSAAYVSGVTDPTDAEMLWNYARMMYLKTGTITDFRDDTSKLNWIYTEDAAVTYLKRLFEWHGAGSFQRDIITATFTAVDIDSTLMPWRIGDYAQIKIPTITSGEYWSGVICGISYDPEKYSANITVRAGQAKQSAGIIIEKRTAETSNIIVEKRTAETTNVITEVRTNGEQ